MVVVCVCVEQEKSCIDTLSHMLRHDYGGLSALLSAAYPLNNLLIIRVNSSCPLVGQESYVFVQSDNRRRCDRLELCFLEYNDRLDHI